MPYFSPKLPHRPPPSAPTPHPPELFPILHHSTVARRAATHGRRRDTADALQHRRHPCHTAQRKHAGAPLSWLASPAGDTRALASCTFRDRTQLPHSIATLLDPQNLHAPKLSPRTRRSQRTALTSRQTHERGRRALWPCHADVSGAPPASPAFPRTSRASTLLAPRAETVPERCRSSHLQEQLHDMSGS